MKRLVIDASDRRAAFELPVRRRSEEDMKGPVAPGQYADFAILSADYPPVPEEQAKAVESGVESN